MEAKRRCDELEGSLKIVESTVNGILQDVHTLREGNYVKGESLHKRSLTLYQRWVTLRKRMQVNGMVNIIRERGLLVLTQVMNLNSNQIDNVISIIHGCNSASTFCLALICICLLCKNRCQNVLGHYKIHTQIFFRSRLRL